MAATTVFNAAALPSCITNCGVLYDVNGACAESSLNNIAGCFCADPKLQAFSTGTAGVCDGACATAPADLGTIQQWYSSFCGNQQGAGAGAGNVVTITNADGSKETSAGSNNASGGSGGGSWLENHYQWVIFLVIMIVAIVGIWVGACIWRRRYLRKKDRQYALGTNLARATESGRVVANASNAGSIHVPSAGMFTPAPISSAGVYNEKVKKEKKKWVVTERT